jgi:hypothetical protein
MSTLLDVTGEKHDMYVVGLQEAPKFSGNRIISEVLGDKYLYVSHPLNLLSLHFASYVCYNFYFLKGVRF